MLRKEDLHRLVPIKANRILHLILVFFAILVVKIWHLSVVQHEEKIESSNRPKQREIFEPAKRGTIRDRYNTPLAINKIQYNIAVLYSQIRDVPRISWENGEKHYKRREHIQKLSNLLADILDLDAARIEDLIHAKASLYFQVPYVIKEDVTEEQYYRLKLLEKDWPGLLAQKIPKRFYPKGAVGNDVIGYLGAISRSEYDAVIQEKKLLEDFFESLVVGDSPSLPEGFESVEEAYYRLEDLTEHAYSVHDYVGKMGVEGSYEQEMRGFFGKKSYFSNAQGSFLKELDAKAPVSGKRVLLSISAELQEYAEKLLIQSEQLRTPRVNGKTEFELPKTRTWIKGGAIVAIDPKTAEVVALASYPRIDPNDFILPGDPQKRKEHQEKISQCFETSHYLGQVWDQRRPLTREGFDFERDQITNENFWMTWDNYIDCIFPDKSPVREGIENVGTVEHAVLLQRRIGRLLTLCADAELIGVFNSLYTEAPHQVHGQPLRAQVREKIDENIVAHAALIEEIKKEIHPFFQAVPRNDDKVLLLDLCRLAVNADQFPDELIPKIGNQSLSEYRKACAAFAVISDEVKQKAAQVFHRFFDKWREENGQAFLKEMRQKEIRDKVRYSKPYIDLFDAQERKMFNTFWAMEKWNLIVGFVSEGRELKSSLRPYLSELEQMREELDPQKENERDLLDAIASLHLITRGLDSRMAKEYLSSLRSYEDLNRPLLGKYRHLRNFKEGQTEQDLACAFYPPHGYGYGRSFAFRQATTQGSIFKVVTAYQSLVQRFHELAGGLKTQQTMNPLTIVDDYYTYKGKRYLGQTSDGTPIPEYYKGGRLIRSHRSNFGDVDLLKALELSSNPYFCLLAGDYIYDPSDLLQAASDFSYGKKTGVDLPGEFAGYLPEDIKVDKTALYSTSIGQHSLVVTPLQAAVCLGAIANGGSVVKPKIVSVKAGKKRAQNGTQTVIEETPTEIITQMEMPPIVRKILLQGMSNIVKREQRVLIGSLEQHYKPIPRYINDFLNLKGQLVAKSGTAESIERVSLDSSMPSATFNHVWYGAISFDEDAEVITLRDSFGEPELIVVIYLKYGAWGKDAAPLAAQIIHKWREIRKRERI